MGNRSRVAEMTGLRPSIWSVCDSSQLWKPVLRDAVTMPMPFKQKDYRVAGAGKMFHHTSVFDPPDHRHNSARVWHWVDCVARRISILSPE